MKTRKVLSIAVLLVLLLVGGCANDLTLSWRSAAGTEASTQVAKRPMWQAKSTATSHSSTSAASSSPLSD